MIRDYWVKNYLSIREKQELNFEAKGPASDLVVEVSKDVFLYRLAILYGSNASGKSNMLSALNAVFNILITAKSDSKADVVSYKPFALLKGEPTDMHVSFYLDGTRYDYDVKYDQKRIIHELMNYYPKGSKSLFYERTFVGEDIQSEIKFGTSLRLSAKTQERIRENTLNNHSVLAVSRKVALTKDVASLTSLHSSIVSRFHDVDGDSEKGIVNILGDAYKDERKRKFYTQMLQKADLNIMAYRPIIEDRVVPYQLYEFVAMEDFPEEMKDHMLRPTNTSVSFLNRSKDGNFEVAMEMQSKGTQKYIRILDALYDMITGNHVYCLDELGEDLHYDLLFYYLNVFIFNSDKSQLIITSQETALLLQDMINDNRGVVWFAEKNHDTASSEYSRGDSYGLHKNLSLYNSYRSGRLGAKPELGSIFIDLES